MKLKHYIKASIDSTKVAVAMNFDSTPRILFIDTKLQDELQNYFEYVNIVSNTPGLYCVMFNDEDINLFRVASSLSEYELDLRSQYENDVANELAEYGYAECYLFGDWYSFSVTLDECPDAASFVEHAKNVIKDTYVDGDSFSCIWLVQVKSGTIEEVLFGNDDLIITSFDDIIDNL